MTSAAMLRGRPFAFKVREVPSRGTADLPLLAVRLSAYTTYPQLSRLRHASVPHRQLYPKTVTETLPKRWSLSVSPALHQVLAFLLVMTTVMVRFRDQDLLCHRPGITHHFPKPLATHPLLRHYR